MGSQCKKARHIVAIIQMYDDHITCSTLFILIHSADCIQPCLRVDLDLDTGTGTGTGRLVRGRTRVCRVYRLRHFLDQLIHRILQAQLSA